MHHTKHNWRLLLLKKKSLILAVLVGVLVCVAWGASLIYVSKSIIMSVAPISRDEAIELLRNYGTDVDDSSIVISRNYTTYSGRITGKVKQNGYWKTVNVTTRHRVEDPFWDGRKPK